MPVDLLFGLESSDLLETVKKAEQSLSVRFEERDGSVYGMYYSYGIGIEPENMRIYRNWDVDENDIIHEPVSVKIFIEICRIPNQQRAEELKSKLERTFKGLLPVHRDDW